MGWVPVGRLREEFSLALFWRFLNERRGTVGPFPPGDRHSGTIVPLEKAHLRQPVFLVVLLALLLVGQQAYSQAPFETRSLDGGPITTDLGYNIIINKGSTLRREWIVVNDPACPLALGDVGIVTEYGGRDYRYRATGSAVAKEPLKALEVRFLLLDVWGAHMKTLSGIEVADLATQATFDLAGNFSWRAWENDVTELHTSVAFVAHVRTGDGRVWAANLDAISRELGKFRGKLGKDVLTPEKEKSGG